MDLKYIAIAICAFLLIFLVFKEITRKNKSLLIWRVLASAMAVASLLLLMIPVSYQTQLKQSLNEINLLTSGAQTDSISKMSGVKYQLATEDYQPVKGINAIKIPDLPYFLETHPEVNQLNVYGYGLKESDLISLQHHKLNFHPTNSLNGIVSANWTTKLNTTEKFYVQGVYKNEENVSVKLVLNGLGNNIDSLIIKPKHTANFDFNSNPKQTGKAVFRLLALKRKDTINNEHLPFIVEEKPEMKVLILASFPDFEYKFLKKWLFDNHYPLAFRSKISKAKYTTDYLNLTNISLSNINSATLNRFDVVIIDEEELASLSANEKAAIQAASNQGLGIIIRISNSKTLGFISDKFSRFEFQPQKDKGLNAILKADDFKLSKLPIEQSIYLLPAANAQVIVADNTAKILAQSKINGLGKITATSLSTTYNWLLTGNTKDYALYWSELLSKTARKKANVQLVKIRPQFPSVNQKINMIVDLAENNKMPKISIDNKPIYPRQNMEMPFQWDATFWPVNEGWNTIFINQMPESFYVYAKQDWTTSKNNLRIEQTKQFIKNNKFQSIKNKDYTKSITQEVSKWWFFAAFILSAGFLWLESRLLKNN